MLSWSVLRSSQRCSFYCALTMPPSLQNKPFLGS